ncbi:ATP-dependent protease [Alteromonas phage vB_AmeM_PT11-V22]|uniref:Clp protease n=1 Tax=Alteromonas phage vB_AmeM_PT11-V22 TaxID=2704031 RepID=A0A6C0R1S4_9CAUD|nr:ATP-dependent protease [Alteromonas phage vB_AmeM_PT11-V22]QHZ59876.1 Clp protease [Alteromonas phage vB_AmeM_PT11-V22]
MSEIMQFEKCGYKKQSLGDKHVFDTPEYIEHLSQFQQLIDVCEEAHQDEVIILNVMCNGGRFDVTTRVYNALMHTEATVLTINQNSAASGGSILLLAGDQIGYSPFSTTMIHTSTLGKYPDKLPEIKGGVDNHDTALRDFYKQVYTGFLTEEELEDVLKGQPLYVYDDEHHERLERLFEYRKSLQEEFQEEQSQGLPTKEDLLKKTKKELVAMMVGEDEEGGR